MACDVSPVAMFFLLLHLYLHCGLEIMKDSKYFLCILILAFCSRLKLYKTNCVFHKSTCCIIFSCICICICIWICIWFCICIVFEFVVVPINQLDVLLICSFPSLPRCHIPWLGGKSVWKWVVFLSKNWLFFCLKFLFYLVLFHTSPS